jgi:GH43 family beta-xylosidase
MKSSISKMASRMTSTATGSSKHTVAGQNQSSRPIHDMDTPDPWILAHEGQFYLTFTSGDHVEIWRSDTIHDFRSADRADIWRPARDAPFSQHIWAPELHLVNDVWYVYVAAASPHEDYPNGRLGTPMHRCVVLRCCGPDPMVPSDWEFVGPIRNAPDHWGIDATLFSLNSGSDQQQQQQLYCVWSGWQLGDYSDTQQDLFIMKLKNPEEAIPGTYACIARAELPWERTSTDNSGGTRGILEGPTFVSLPDGSWSGIVYSASGSWDPAYCLGLLELTNPDDPCDPASWRKRKKNPLLVSDPMRKLAPFGPGHASFVHTTENESTMLCIHHATDTTTDGWANRKGTRETTWLTDSRLQYTTTHTCTCQARHPH